MWLLLSLWGDISIQTMATTAFTVKKHVTQFSSMTHWYVFNSIRTTTVLWHRGICYIKLWISSLFFWPCTGELLTIRKIQCSLFWVHKLGPRAHTALASIWDWYGKRRWQKYSYSFVPCDCKTSMAFRFFQCVRSVFVCFTCLYVCSRFL